MRQVVLVALVATSSACGGASPNLPPPVPVSAEIRSLSWSAMTPVRVDEASLATPDAGSDGHLTHVVVSERHLLDELGHLWSRPTALTAGNSGDFDMRLVVLMRYSDGTTHRLGLDRACSALFFDGRAHLLDAALLHQLIGKLPQAEQALIREWGSPACASLVDGSARDAK